MSLDAVGPYGAASTGMRLANRLAHIVGWMCAGVLKLLAASWRVNLGDLDRIDRLIAAGTPVVVVFWHGSYLPLFAMAAGRPVTVFTSRSFRGQVIASICRVFGYAPSLLAPGRRGYHRMREVLFAQKENGADPVAIAVDGPLGPRHEVKPGAILVASRLNAVLVPLSVKSHPNWTITSRWDHFTVPLPFARVSLQVGEPIIVPDDLSTRHDELSKIQQRVVKQLNRA